MYRYLFKCFSQLIILILKVIIRGYQICLSPFLGNNCRFYPSCSHYALQALDRYYLVKALWIICKRLIKCHPLHPGGFDPLPDKKGKKHEF